MPSTPSPRLISPPSTQETSSTMQNPKHEIQEIIAILTSTTSNLVLASTITKYFTADVTFLHPLCRADSRAELLGIYQWYRIISPHTKSRVVSVMYDPDLDALDVETVQWFRLRISPFSPVPSRLITRLTLREVKGLHYIVRQEDFYHPTDFLALTIPGMIVIVWLFLKISSIACNLYAWLFIKAGIAGRGLEGGYVTLLGLRDGLLSLRFVRRPISVGLRYHTRTGTTDGNYTDAQTK